MILRLMVDFKDLKAILKDTVLFNQFILDPGLSEGLLSNRPCPSWSVGPSLNISRDYSKDFSNFGPRVYPKGSLVIALVGVCVSVCPSLNISETAH